MLHKASKLINSLQRKSFKSSLKQRKKLLQDLSTTLTQDLLVHRNFLQEFVLVQIVHHIDLLVVIR
jgi:hypothetical protein